MDSQTKTYLINTCIIITVLVAIVIFTGSNAVTALFITSLGGIMFISMPILQNLLATVVLTVYPIYNDGDVIVVNNTSVADTSILFNKLGLLRTAFYNKAGDVVYVPNMELLNGYVKKIQ